MAFTRLTHGKSYHPIYNVWGGMIARCHNPRYHAYPRYGARGIAVCDRWRTFENFYADMGDAPAGFTLDRIDNDKGYSPENCRWADRKTQSNNRGNNVRIEFNGESLTMSQWAERIGITRSNLRIRIKRLQWPIERALTERLARRTPRKPKHGSI